jgi:hypothetical protein
MMKLGRQKESLDRGCRDISGVMGPLAEGAEVSDDGRMADAESSRRASDFAGAVDLPLPWGVADVDACLPPRL